MTDRSRGIARCIAGAMVLPALLMAISLSPAASQVPAVPAAEPAPTRCPPDVSEATAAIAAAASVADAGVVVIPRHCRVDRAVLSRALPPDGILLDLSGLSGNDSPGETTKIMGMFAADTASSDSQWQVASGHHPVINLNNYGTSGSQSAAARRASILWSAGDFARGASKTGFRGGAILQFGQEAGRDHWSLSLRSLAPWPALAAGYEMWAPREAIGGPGIYRSTGQVILRSDAAGVTGSAMPDSTGESLRDGSVRWRVVDAADRSLMRISDTGHVLFGLGDLRAQFRQKVSIFTPGDLVAEWAATGPAKDVTTRFLPTNGAGEEVPAPALRASADGGLKVVDGADNRRVIASFDARAGLVTSATAVEGELVTLGGEAIDVMGRGLLFLASPVPRDLVRLTGGVDGQVVSLHFLDSRTTLANGTDVDEMHLEGSRPFVGTLDSVVVLRRLPSALGGRWVEISRSAK